MELVVAGIEHVHDLAERVDLSQLRGRDAEDHAAVAGEQQAVAAVTDQRDLSADAAVVVVEIHEVELGRVVSQDCEESVSERCVGFALGDLELLGLLAFERRRLDLERRGARGAVLCRECQRDGIGGTGHEADDLELVLCGNGAFTVRRALERLGAVLLVRCDLVGNGHRIRRGKADVARERIGTEGVGDNIGVALVKRSRCIRLIELGANFCLLVHVIGGNKLLVQLFLLARQLIALFAVLCGTGIFGSGCRACRHSQTGKGCQRPRAQRPARHHAARNPVMHARCQILHTANLQIMDICICIL